MEDCELKLLSEAAADLEHLSKTSRTYAELRKLLADNSRTSITDFRTKFSKYYGLNHAGLSAQWKDAYFEMLFSFRKRMPKDPHRVALQKLYPLPRLKKDNALQCSFVSKLVAIHDERQPLFDKYVQCYFGLGPPSLTGLTDFRISGFVQNLQEIRRRYETWSHYKPFAQIVDRLRKKVPDLAECHSVRICDFLVWSVGNKYT
jgi:hypothetical protein